ncbi:MAG: glutamine synthetase family protein [Roseiflexaceae bacterium]
MTPETIYQKAKEADVRLVRFLYCDNGGTIRGKTTALSGLPGRLSDGIGMTVAMMAMNSLDQLQPLPGLGPVGEVRLLPDPESFTLLHHTPHTAALMCDLVTQDRRAWAVCPRGFLKRMRARAAANSLHLRAALETEFTLARHENGRFVPFDRTLCFSSIGMDEVAPLATELVGALESQGLIVEQCYPQLGHGQHEITVRHTEALFAADNHLRLRETIRAVARRHGLYASLAPKPFPDQPGNGSHIHFSLWNNTGQNLFYDASTPDNLSLVGRQFMAGVLAHLPALLALTCPSVNSYRRLRPQAWSSAFGAWGYENREAAVRVVSPFWSNAEGTINLELRAADSSCNPYLALGALLAAGLDGVTRQLSPGEPTLVDPSTLNESERQARGLRRLPDQLDEALDALEGDPVLLEALGEPLAQAFLAVRRSEARAYAEMDEVEEYAQHFYKY